MGTQGHLGRKNFTKEKRSLDTRVEELQRDLFGDVVRGIQLTGRESIMEVLSKSHPAFGGKLFRRAYELIRKAISENYTIFVSVAGPITASDYARVWMVPFMKLGYIAAFTASDAITYHDAHDAVEGKRRVYDVDLYGNDILYRNARIIRITDIGFPEEVLFNTDKFFTFALTNPEFQRELTTTEYRWNLGRYIHALEEKKGVTHGLIATAFECDVPGFCPSPADGSSFLEVVKLWIMQDRLGEKLKIHQPIQQSFNLRIDLPKDVYEFCALHYWAQKKEGNKELAYITCGGGAVKNYLLQPEPALEQVLFVPTKKYKIGVQFTTAPVTDGSLSSAAPNEAITWGKLQRRSMTVSVPADYTMLMSIISHAILRERALYEDELKNQYKGDKEKFFRENPQATGFFRELLRLYKKREQAMSLLDGAARKHLREMKRTLKE